MLLTETAKVIAKSHSKWTILVRLIKKRQASCWERKKKCKHPKWNWQDITYNMNDLIMLKTHIQQPTQIVAFIFKSSLKLYDDLNSCVKQRKKYGLYCIIFRRFLKYDNQSKPWENINQWRLDLHLKVVGFLISSGKYLQGYEKN